MFTKESLLFHGIESSSRSGDLLPVTRRNALLKAAFLLGNRGEKREIIAAIRGAAEIPPAVKWDAETIKDCVANYYFENNRYPRVFDLCLLNCLPTAEAIKYVFGVSAQRWLDGYRCFVVGFESEAASGQGTGKRTKKKIARITRKQALLAAESVLEGEEKERVREMIAEYPIAEWNERNVADVLISFYEKYGRVPAEREMKNSCELPYYGIFRYRFHMTYRAFLRKFLPPLYEILCGSANERNNAEASGEISGALSGAAKKQGAKSAERKRKSETKKGEPKRGKTKSGKIKSIKIIRVDFGGSVFYPTFSNVQDYCASSRRQLSSIRGRKYARFCAIPAFFSCFRRVLRGHFLRSTTRARRLKPGRFPCVRFLCMHALRARKSFSKRGKRRGSCGKSRCAQAAKRAAKKRMG